MRLRRMDVLQLWIVGVGLMFLLTVVALAQVPALSQDGINATLFERVADFGRRLDRVETYLTAAIVALVANSVAHLVNIRSASRSRTHLYRPDE